jgi:hypothetical protein
MLQGELHFIVTCTTPLSEPSINDTKFLNYQLLREDAVQGSYDTGF